MKIIISYLIMLVSANILFAEIPKGNGEYFIYGKVTTTHGKEYVGAIRWGDEEICWIDIFNSTKTENEYIKYVDNEYNTRRHKRRSSNGIIKFIKNILGEDEDYFWGITVHKFSCQFKDLKSISINSRNRVDVELKNGKIIELEGGSNDVGTNVNVYDDQLGMVELKWRMVEKVEFMDTPPYLKNTFGKPLFGTVETYDRKFIGFIRWDHDERITTDILNGKNNEGSYKLNFEKVKSISKTRRGSNVTLKNGNEMELWGSNDIDDRNKGIIVYIQDLGFVDIGWDEFESVTFEDVPGDISIRYESLETPKILEGKVINDMGETFSGRIVYDLDETLGIEILAGKEYDVKYNIPFKFIKNITPMGYYEAEIELFDGRTFMLGDMRDVSDENDGIIVFDSNNKSHYIQWRDIEEIVFN